jgi:hypothetical protein
MSVAAYWLRYTAVFVSVVFRAVFAARHHRNRRIHEDLSDCLSYPGVECVRRDRQGFDYRAVVNGVAWEVHDPMNLIQQCGNGFTGEWGVDGNTLEVTACQP